MLCCVKLCPSSELGAGDGGGHGYVEGFGGGTVLGVGGDEEFVGDEGFYLVADAFALVAHDDDAVGSERTVVDVAPVQECAIDGGGVAVCLKEEILQVGIVHADARDGSHSGLYGLGVEDVCRFGGADDVLYAKPVGQSADGAQIAGILHSVKSKDKPFGACLGLWQVPLWQGKEGQHLLGMLKQGGALEFCFADDIYGAGERLIAMQGRFPTCGVAQIYGAMTSHKEFANKLVPFCHEESLLAAVFLLLERVYLFYACLAKHFYYPMAMSLISKISVESPGMGPAFLGP